MTASLICAIDGENVDFALDSGVAYTRLDCVRRFKTGDFPTFTDKRIKDLVVTGSGVNDTFARAYRA